MFPSSNPATVEAGSCPQPGFSEADSSTGTDAGQLLSIIRQGQLSAVFQPILNFRQKRYFGFEGLIRGPRGSRFHSPLALFETARQYDLQRELERACRETVLCAFARVGLPGRLFINLSPDALIDPHFANGTTRALLKRLGLPPERIVIELTENQQIEDFAAMRDILADYRKEGYQIAIDDLGEGFANLRMWSEVQPEFIKIDRSLISGINDNKLKFLLVRSMQEISEACGSRIIAEGIETEEELSTVLGLGISYGQGFLIARPSDDPVVTPSSPMLEHLAGQRIVTSPIMGLYSVYQNTVRDLLRRVEAVTPAVDNEEIYKRFKHHPDIEVIPVVVANRPIGIIDRHYWIEHFTRPFCRELYGHKSCTQFMNAMPLLIDHDAAVQEVGLIVSRVADRCFGDDFIITQDGNYLGMGSSKDLMALITEMQISAARYANPLTLLPGSVPVNQQIDRLLSNETGFTACYCDIDHFKPFNDAYGYSKGDDMIQLVGQLLAEICDQRIDFIGHIGGDDFIVLFQSADWQERCACILKAFDQRAALLSSDQDRAQGGRVGKDRRGNREFHPLPSLSIGALPVLPGQFCSHHEISVACADAKKQAKETLGSSLFVERRRLPQDDCPQESWAA